MFICTSRSLSCNIKTCERLWCASAGRFDCRPGGRTPRTRRASLRGVCPLRALATRCGSRRFWDIRSTEIHHRQNKSNVIYLLFIYSLLLLSYVHPSFIHSRLVDPLNQSVSWRYLPADIFISRLYPLFDAAYLSLSLSLSSFTLLTCRQLHLLLSHSLSLTQSSHCQNFSFKKYVGLNNVSWCDMMNFTLLGKKKWHYDIRFTFQCDKFTLQCETIILFE